jgi:hypothetical protein
MFFLWYWLEKGHFTGYKVAVTVVFFHNYFVLFSGGAKQ